MEVLKVTINICSKHFACWGHEMQCASTAIQLFSATYAAAFRLAGEKDKADVIITINNWFDCMNSKSSGLEQANKFRSPLGTQWEHQEQAMLAMLKLMESMVRHGLYLLIVQSHPINYDAGDWTSTWQQETHHAHAIPKGFDQIILSVSNSYILL